MDMGETSIKILLPINQDPDSHGTLRVALPKHRKWHPRRN